ncbi:MAG: hypothetical protein SFY69_02230 [Planctomycetota bacterium]|nr:hypothetical protein [Planctomycetota bacterium]
MNAISGGGLGRFAARALLAGCAVLAGVGGVGCQQYVSSPGVPTARGIPENPNKPAALTCMVEAVRYVATRYPPGDLGANAETVEEAMSLQAPYPLVVNPPRGLRQTFYDRLVKQVGPQAQPASPTNTLGPDPVFHITRVWMRFDKATVDVLRPMPELGPGPDGAPIYQTVTVRLTGGLSPWRVVHARAWPPDEPVQIPPPYPMPEFDRVDQFEWQLEQDQVNPPDRSSY